MERLHTPQRYLCQLAIESSKEWDKLMQELNDSSLQWIEQAAFGLAMLLS